MPEPTLQDTLTDAQALIRYMTEPAGTVVLNSAGQDIGTLANRELAFDATGALQIAQNLGDLADIVAARANLQAAGRGATGRADLDLHTARVAPDLDVLSETGVWRGADPAGAPGTWLPWVRIATMGDIPPA